MTEYSLRPHPDHPPAGVRAVTVTLAMRGDVVTLRYHVDAALPLILPPLAAPRRADGLWRTTCFELFLKPVGGPSYVEYNFSPSRAWAAYSFDDHRAGMRDLECSTDPVVDRAGDGIVAECRIAAPMTSRALRMALTAVIDEATGTRSFWSLAHPAGPADFHHDACFAAALPPRTPA